MSRVVYHEPDGDLLAIVDAPDTAYERRLDRLHIEWERSVVTDIADSATADLNAHFLKEGAVRRRPV